jgi:squalene-hopene/tetraprenyl-beta-curcumene cyclase
MKLVLTLMFTAFATTVAAQQAPSPSGNKVPNWDPAAAAAYLDARMDLWFAKGAKLQTGDAKTTCVSCHAGLSYALSRPVLRRVMQVDTPSAQEARLIDETTRRVQTYDAHQVLYDFNERLQIDSRGTEAVLNAVILTSADAARGRREPSATTKKALARLWETQRADGRWDWLDVGLAPWETKDGAYYGATLAAFAVGAAAGQHDAAATAGIERLRTYLSSNYSAQPLYNRTWALLASTRLERAVADAQRDALVAELVSLQRDDGGWSLEAMGPWKRSKTALMTQSDGYATGLVVYTLKQAGIPSSHVAIRKGVQWLERNQIASPVPETPGRAWLSNSLNYDREHGGEKGEPWRRLFMSDTATAFAILALADK